MQFKLPILTIEEEEGVLLKYRDIKQFLNNLKDCLKKQAKESFALKRHENGKISMKITKSSRNYRIFQKFNNIGSLPQMIDNDQFDFFSRKKHQNSLLDAGMEMLNNQKIQRYVPFNLLLSKNVKTYYN